MVVVVVQIVLSISAEHNKKLRDLAMDKYGGKKGALSALVEEGIDLAEEDAKRKWAHSKLVELAKNSNLKMGGKFDRKEMYAERMRQKFS